MTDAQTPAVEQSVVERDIFMEAMTAFRALNQTLNYRYDGLELKNHDLLSDNKIRLDFREDRFPYRRVVFEYDTVSQSFSSPEISTANVLNYREDGATTSEIFATLEYAYMDSSAQKFLGKNLLAAPEVIVEEGYIELNLRLRNKFRGRIRNAKGEVGRLPFNLSFYIPDELGIGMQLSMLQLIIRHLDSEVLSIYGGFRKLFGLEPQETMGWSDSWTEGDGEGVYIGASAVRINRKGKKEVYLTVKPMMGGVSYTEGDEPYAMEVTMAYIEEEWHLVEVFDNWNGGRFGVGVIESPRPDPSQAAPAAPEQSFLVAQES